MTWKLTLESSPELDPNFVFMTVPISRIRKAVLPVLGTMNEVLKAFLGGYVKIEKPMSGDMIVKMSFQAGGKSLPDFHIRITGDQDA